MPVGRPKGQLALDERAEKINLRYVGFLLATLQFIEVGGRARVLIKQAREAVDMHMFQKITVGILFGVFLIAVSDADEWDEAEKQINRLNPSEFSELPRNVIDELKARGCRIPQAYGLDKRHNVVKGRFATKYQQDWAALCSKDGFSEILIFWGGSARCSSELRKNEDRRWLQVVARKTIGYSRAIDVVGIDQIQSYYEASGGPTPPPIDHEGIDHAFVGKASVIHYCNQGQWIELTGMD